MNTEGLRGELLPDEPMARHTTWRVGGPARRRYRPADAAALAACPVWVVPERHASFASQARPVDAADIGPMRARVEAVSGVRLVNEVRRLGREAR
jgi:UDP-N-acetylenolpyruvoylglucosamine reductase